MARLLDHLQELGFRNQATVLAQRVAPNVDVTHPFGLAELLDSLHSLGADDQVAVLAERAAAHTDITRVTGVDRLLASMRKAGAADQGTALGERYAAFLEVLITSDSAARFVQEMERRMATAGQVDELPALGLFDHFLKHDDHGDRFRFGREPDGSPADPWSWDEL
uniref:hypothetical protein n=1 Tax=Herbidospora sakaeratensis TaxID=564415 RepID=UPI0012F9B7D9|nr:hypothetical protein [Herbidospora sakaeratensis]